MFQVEVWLKNNDIIILDSVTSIEIAKGPFRRKLTDDQIRKLEFKSSDDIYIFDKKTYHIDANTLRRLSIEG